MKFNPKSLLRNTKVLYIVFGLALINFFSYLLSRKFDAILLFLGCGILTRYLFSKNMIVILLVSLIVTNVVLFFKGVKEGLENKKDEIKNKDKKMAMKEQGAMERDAMKQNAMEKNGMQEGAMMKNGGGKKMDTEQFESRLTASNFNEDENDVQDDEVFQDVMDGGKKIPKIDYASTLESAYDNLDKLLGSDAIRSMTEDTQRLAEKQKKLMGNIQKLEPMMSKAGDMINGLNIDGMGDMLKGLEGKMSMFGGSKKVKAYNSDEEE
jgi:hypothetical protein